jgi:hypothetical protein
VAFLNVPCDLAQSLLTKRVEGFFYFSFFFFFFLQVMGFAIITYLTPLPQGLP